MTNNLPFLLLTMLRRGVSAPSATAVLSVAFATDDAAPLTSPYSGEVGELTIVQTDGTFAASGGALAFTAQTTPAWGDQRFYGAAVARAAGRAVATRHRYTTGGIGIYMLAFARVTNPAISGGSGIEHAIPRENNQVKLIANAALVGVGGHVFETLNSATDYPIAIVLRTSGAFYFSKLGGSWELIWIDGIASTATLYPLFANYDSAGSMDYFNVGDLPAPFTTDNGIALLNVASPSGSYTGVANALIEMALTAPGSITTEAGFRFRVVDANNYWRAYFNTSGALRIDSVEAGVATNRINVAGVITGGATVTIRVISDGTAQDAWSLSGTTWTKRGSQLTNNIHPTATGIETDIGAGWTAANLRVYERASAQYTVLDTLAFLG